MVEKIGDKAEIGVTKPWVLLVIVFSCFGFGPLERGEQAKTLLHDSGVRVVVKIGLSKDGPVKHLLQNDVENKIREENVTLIQENTDHNQVPPPSLYVEVAIWKMSDRPYIYFINANFYQSVRLVKNEDFTTQAATWQTGLIGEGDLQRIRQDVVKVTDTFLRSYKRNMHKSPS